MVELGSHLRIEESLRAQDNDKQGQQCASTRVNRDGYYIQPLKGQNVFRLWFKTYESLNDVSILHMGNESTTLVHVTVRVILMAVVRLPDPKLKTLGEKGIEFIFVGYVEHSKAFRFYVIEPNDSVSINFIIESRDAIFDENRFSSVPRPSLRIPNRTEDIGGSVVPEEVTEEVVQQPEPELRKSKRNRNP
ncbi:hypothetical protein Tco_0328770 [Tanacetum coccineum]